MYKRGKCWYSDFWYDGQRYTRSWGRISKTVASEKEQRFKTEVYEGKHAQKARRIIFERFSTKYLEHARMHKRPSSVRRNAVSIKMLMPHFRDKLLQSIHPYMVEKYKKVRKDNGVNVATINRDIDTLRDMLQKAVEWGYLKQNPMANIKKFRESGIKMWVLAPDEEKRLLDECDRRKQKVKYLRDLVLFALNTGMRKSEIFHLKIEDVHLSDRYLLVRDTKTHENRNVPINDTVHAILGGRMNHKSGYVFETHRQRRIEILTSSFWKAVEKAGLEKRDGTQKVRLRFHDLRHTFGARLGMAGVDLKTIMEIMGHKTHVVAMRYQHPTRGHKLESVKILDEVPSKVPSPRIGNMNKSIKTASW